MVRHCSTKSYAGGEKNPAGTKIVERNYIRRGLYL